MAQIRNANVRRVEVDTIDEVAKMFSDVYRVLREQQTEIDTLRAAPARPVAPAPQPTPPQAPPEPVVAETPKPTQAHKKESKK